ncbi:MAG TPA: PAS domain-containing protein [Thermoanaerobaculia bacterium]|jgi:photoactive yellow protein|nr:PAS domain-containing protein [Thermoanaerobaculia bacterium]
MNDAAPLIGHAEIERIQSSSELELDQLPFGAIRLDREGTILSFNQAEVDLSGHRKENVLGRNFFTQVAPCTNVQDFAGKFREGVALGRLHTVFPYVFDYEMEPRHVWVTLFYSNETGTAWVFVRDDRRLSRPH